MDGLIGGVTPTAGCALTAQHPDRLKSTMFHVADGRT